MPSGALRTQADQLASSRQAINARINAAKSAGDDASAKHLLDIRDALDAQVGAVVPEAGQFNQTFKDFSRPLDVFQPGQSVNAVPNAVARDNFGNLNGTPPSQIPDSFLTGQATKEKLDQLVSAYGGDKNAAESALQDHLAGVVTRAAVNPDGTLDPAKFAKALQPYQKTLNSNGGMWFPGLKAKFATAQAAQGTLDTMTAQRGIADSIGAGDLRDQQSGVITGQSFNGWLKANKAQLAQAQSPAAVMRLHQIGSALKERGRRHCRRNDQRNPPRRGGYDGRRSRSRHPRRHDAQGRFDHFRAVSEGREQRLQYGDRARGPRPSVRSNARLKSPARALHVGRGNALVCSRNHQVGYRSAAGIYSRAVGDQVASAVKMRPPLRLY